MADSSPPVRRSCWTAFRASNSAAQTMFGVAALLGPVVGPTLGGWLVDTYNWRWIFDINLPVGLFGFLACYALLEDPPDLKEVRAELKKRPLNFDGIGLDRRRSSWPTWETVLSKGQEWDSAGRSVLAGADAAACVPVGTGGRDLSRTAVCQPGG